MKTIIKRIFLGISFLIAAPFILITRICYLINLENIFNTFGAGLSLIPGKIGSYVRVAYYIGTIKKMSPDVVIGFGSFFSRRTAEVGKNVYIGAYCIIGNVRLEDDILIASRVSIPSGKNQHGSREVSDDELDEIKIQKVKIGKQVWIGEGAIVMADVGSNSIVGSGSVVTRAIPANTVAVGNPAKPKFERPPQKHA